MRTPATTPTTRLYLERKTNNYQLSILLFCFGLPFLLFRDHLIPLGTAELVGGRATTEHPGALVAVRTVEAGRPLAKAVHVPGAVGGAQNHCSTTTMHNNDFTS